MFNPCVEHCYNRYGKQYSSDCDDKCEFAKEIKEKRILGEKSNKYDEIIKQINITVNSKNEYTSPNTIRTYVNLSNILKICDMYNCDTDIEII